MRRPHDNVTCMSHWQLGPYSSALPGPCGPMSSCECACHQNGVEFLIILLAKLNVDSAEDRIVNWVLTMPSHGRSRDIY